MATLQELQRLIDLHDLADKLGLERPGGSGNYRSPRHEDKSPSLSIFQTDQGQAWKDHSTGEGGGNPPSLIAYVESLEFGPAVRRCHELYGIPLERPKVEKRPQTALDGIARACLQSLDGVIDYLTGRGIPESVVRNAHRSGALGFSDWHSTKRPEGSVGYQGPGVAFIVRTLNPGHVAAIDKRFFDPSLNGDVKTWTMGEKEGLGWYSNLRRLERARTVYICESAINALSIEAANIPYSAAYATRGTAGASNIDWRFLAGKRVVVCMDADEPDDRGRRPGPEAAWAIHEACTALDVPCLLVDQVSWYEKELNDVNDFLQKEGEDALRTALRELEPWAIPGLPGKDQPGRKRIFLPAHDWKVYWRFRSTEDFTSYLERAGDDGDEGPRYKDVCGFRIAALARVNIASATATMTGDTDAAPKSVFAASVDVPRYSETDELQEARLLRRVMDDERLHNVDQWRKFGPIFNQAAFSRLVSIWERASRIGARDAVNFVGLCWRRGKPVVNEGPDCYFTDPKQQCPYWNLRFPSGTRDDARRVVDAYQATFTHNAASLVLVWALGGHLKAYLGFWPHMELQADKGAGKSTLLKHLERTLAMTVYSGQQLQTEFRLLTNISHTSHPVGWEELSARGQVIIDKAVSLLQEAYNYSATTRGSEMREFLVSAPVLVAGEDVPARGVIGKMVSSDLTGRKGDLIPEDLPKFPLKEWLEHLAGLGRARVRELHRECEAVLHEGSAASKDDPGAQRMVGNYAALAVSWRLLCDWLGLAESHGDFFTHLVTRMNAHIIQTQSEREPWVWILETVFSEIDRQQYRFPFVFDNVDGDPCLIIKVEHVIDHIAHSTNLRHIYDSLSVKRARVLKQQLQRAGVVRRDELDRKIAQRRQQRMIALSLHELERWGLSPSWSEEDWQDDQRGFGS